MPSAIPQSFGEFFTDDRGGEVIEYAIIAGLIAVACVVIISTVGTKAVARWTSVNSSI